MLQLPLDLHVDPASVDGSDSRDASGEDRDADSFFRDDAERLGYLIPGGRGLAAYYHDFGLTPPGPVDRVRTPDGRKPREIFGLDFDREIE